MFELRFGRRAAAAYARLPKKIAGQVNRALERLCADPSRTPNVKPLHGELDGLMRVRVGDYRIIFEIDRRAHVIHVHGLGPRGDVYK